MSTTLAAPAMTPASEKSGTSVYFDADSASTHAAHSHAYARGDDPNASTDTVTAPTNSNGTAAGAGADVDRQPSVATGGRHGIFGILKKRSKHDKVADNDNGAQYNAPQTMNNGKSSIPVPANSNSATAPAAAFATPGVLDDAGRVPSGYAADSEPDGEAATIQGGAGGEKRRRSVDFASAPTVEGKSNGPLRHSIGSAPGPQAQGQQYLQQQQFQQPAQSSTGPATGGMFLPEVPPSVFSDEKTQTVGQNGASTASGGARDSGFAEAPANTIAGGNFGSQPATQMQERGPVRGQTQGLQGQSQDQDQGQGLVQGQEPQQQSEHNVTRGTSSGAFAAGAALTGPAAQPEANPSQHQRSVTAEESLSTGTMAKINKGECMSFIFSSLICVVSSSYFWSSFFFASQGCEETHESDQG